MILLVLRSYLLVNRIGYTRAIDVHHNILVGVQRFWKGNTESIGRVNGSVPCIDNDLEQNRRQPFMLSLDLSCSSIKLIP